MSSGEVSAAPGMPLFSEFPGGQYIQLIYLFQLFDFYMVHGSHYLNKIYAINSLY